jgi:hypothetical protein
MAVRTTLGAALVGRRVKRKLVRTNSWYGYGVVEWYDGTLDLHGRPLGFKVKYDNGRGEIVRGDTLREIDGWFLVNDAASDAARDAARDEENDVVIERQLDAEEARLERLREAREAGEEIDLLSDDDDGDRPSLGRRRRRRDGDGDGDADAPAGRTRQEVEAALRAVRIPHGGSREYYTLSAKQLAIKRKALITRLTGMDVVQDVMHGAHAFVLRMIDTLTEMISLREELTSIDEAAAAARKRARTGGRAPRAALPARARPAGARAGTGRTRSRRDVEKDFAAAVPMTGHWEYPTYKRHYAFIWSSLQNMTLKDMKSKRELYASSLPYYEKSPPSGTQLATWYPREFGRYDGDLSVQDLKHWVEYLDRQIPLREELELVLTEEPTRRPIDVTR